MRAKYTMRDNNFPSDGSHHLWIRYLHYEFGVLKNPFIFDVVPGLNRGAWAMVDDREDVYSKAVRAGKRTYFFDVKSTRGRDLYLTITESKKHTHADGTASYDKHKIFLYKEDFEKFFNGLQDAIEEIDRLKSNGSFGQVIHLNGNGDASGKEESHPPISAEAVTPFTDLNFEDLDRKDI